MKYGPIAINTKQNIRDTWTEGYAGFDLAEMYGTETKYLKRSVKNNIKRFPSDFMFELTKEEFDRV